MTELQTLKNQQEQLNDELSTQKKINEDKDILISTLTQRNNELEEKLHALTQQTYEEELQGERLETLTSYATGQELRLLQIRKAISGCAQCMRKCERDQLFNGED